MMNFEQYLEQTQEIGTVTQVHNAIVYAQGLPEAKPHEMVVFETGEIGEVLSFSKKNVEILLFSKKDIRVGTKVTRTDEQLSIPVGDAVLGKTINPLGLTVETDEDGQSERRAIDAVPLPMLRRRNVREQLETGVTMVDLVIPLGIGQRELVIGDRKTGKTEFVQQTVMSQAQKGFVCVYAAIAKRQVDILEMKSFFERQGVSEGIVTVATAADDPSGLIFLTPYTAMTIAEYFRDQGRNVLVILDDMSIHAKYHREISLLAKRFPGRSSYPGDIFYLHAKLMERAGNFEKGSITCLPIAETVFGDLSGYIQTNLMAMTDGHIFFDKDLSNLGRRPPINPFLSVTRVGRQTQSELMRDMSRELSIFLVHHEKMRQFMHFGGEVSENIKRTLAMGDQVISFFDQPPERVVPMNINGLLTAGLWSGYWAGAKTKQMKEEMLILIKSYRENEAYRAQVDQLIGSSQNFSELVEQVKHRKDEFITRMVPVQVKQAAQGGQA